jgi:hypothetical protein
MRRLVLLLALVACSKGDKAASSHGEVLAMWKGAGLETTGFDKAEKDATLGVPCRAGTVAGFEAQLCEYPDEKAAKEAAKPGYDKVGTASTGISVAHGKLLLIAADRKGADPSGKKMNEVQQTFLGRKKT